MCTGVRFSDKEGNMYFGRNLDWSFSYGESILATPRGYHYDNVFGASGKATPNAVIGVGVVMADRPINSRMLCQLSYAGMRCAQDINYTR